MTRWCAHHGVPRAQACFKVKEKERLGDRCFFFFLGGEFFLVLFFSFLKGALLFSFSFSFLLFVRRVLFHVVSMEKWGEGF